MATFTSTQDGNWNDGGTWGNTSPGVEGTDYPSDGDTINIGHTVTYDRGNETDEYAAITVSTNGILICPGNTDSTIRMASNADITLTNGGQLLLGEESDPVGPTYEVNVILRGTSYPQITTQSGGKLEAWGSSIRSTQETTLASDWDSGVVLTVTGNMVGDWEVGDLIAVHRKDSSATGGYNASNYPRPADSVQYGGHNLFEIASLTINGTNTDVEIITDSEPSDIYYAGGEVWNLTKNIKIIGNNDISIDTVMDGNGANFGYARIYNTDNTSTINVNLNHAQLNRFRDISTGEGWIFKNCTVSMGNNLIYNMDSITVEDCLLYYGSYGLYQIGENSTIKNTKFMGFVRGMYNISGSNTLMENLEFIACNIAIAGVYFTDIDNNSYINMIKYCIKGLYEIYNYNGNLSSFVHNHEYVGILFENCELSIFQNISINNGWVKLINQCNGCTFELSSIGTPNIENSGIHLFLDGLVNCKVSGVNGDTFTIDGYASEFPSASITAIASCHSSTFNLELTNFSYAFRFNGDHNGVHIPNQFFGEVSNIATQVFDSSNQIIFKGRINHPSSLFGATGTNVYDRIVIENSAIDGAIKDFYATFYDQAVIESLRSGDSDWQTPPSGNNWILKFIPNTGQAYDVYKMSMSLNALLVDYCTTGNKILRFKAYPSGWSSDITTDELWTEVYYLNQLGDKTRNYKRSNLDSTETIISDTWNNIDLSFNQVDDGIIYFNLFLQGYEAGAYVLVDPVWEIITV